VYSNGSVHSARTPVTFPTAVSFSLLTVDKHSPTRRYASAVHIATALCLGLSVCLSLSTLYQTLDLEKCLGTAERSELDINNLAIAPTYPTLCDKEIL